MYKLLPPEQKEVVEREYHARRAIVILIALIAVIVVGMVGLFPSYLLSTSRHEEVLERTRLAGDLSPAAAEAEITQWLESLNLRLQTFSDLREPARPSLSVEAVLESREAGVRLTSFDWKKQGGAITLLVSGIARDRQSLLSFEESLESSGRFASVELPVSNLAKERDIDFQIKLAPSPAP